MNLSSERTNYASIICKSQRIIPFPLTCRRLFTIYESPVGLWTERLYEESPGKRPMIDRALMAFEQALSRQDRTEIEQARKQLTRLLDEIEYDLT